MDPRQIAIADFSYDLPASKIALYPLPERDQSRLLIYRNKGITEDIYKNIAEYLPEDSFLIFNNSKVIPARILFKKASGAVIELFCLEPVVTGEYASEMSRASPVQWKCMIGGAAKWKAGALEKTVTIQGHPVTLTARLLRKTPDAYITGFSWDPPHFTFADVIESGGEVPLPPYIKREADEADKDRYQTIYASRKGSVAAPTAGLHFTKGILSSLAKKNIGTGFVTLHVGAGTFRPVKAALMADHDMHAEWMEINAETISGIIRHLDRPITAVGTTALRMIESLYWIGVKSFLHPNGDEEYLSLKQWEAADTIPASTSLSAAAALQSLEKYLKARGKEKLFVKTQLLITPGYRFKLVNALVTNFHQPRSTLLLLVAAAAGESWKDIYSYALDNNFRFLSYGDGCLIFLQPH